MTDFLILQGSEVYPIQAKFNLMDLATPLDPYPREEQANFAKWCVYWSFMRALLSYISVHDSDTFCSGDIYKISMHAAVSNFDLGPEHQATVNGNAQPSYCTLPIFHPSAAQNAAPSGGYVSTDGHAFTCKNPAVLSQAFHVYVHYLCTCTTI